MVVSVFCVKVPLLQKKVVFLVCFHQVIATSFERVAVVPHQLVAGTSYPFFVVAEQF